MTDQERLTALGLHPGAWRGAPGVFPVPKPSDELRSRYRGCLLGGAIGDALGRPVEGWPRDMVQRSYPGGLRDFQPWHGWKPGPTGTFTDDTQLTIVTAEWLLEARDRSLSGDDMGRRVAEWGRTGRGIGHATRQALRNYEARMPWWRAGVPSAGNGAAMRAAPFGLRYAGQPDALRYAAALGSATTHRDVTAVASAIVQAAAVNLCLATTPGDLDAEDFLAALVASVDGLDAPELPLRSTGQPRSLTQRIEEVHDYLGRPTDEAFDHFFNGAFVLETTPIVLWLLLTYAHDPEEALVTAVMGGRDADTTAAILGNLIGALHGAEAFPERWTDDNLEGCDRLVGLAEALYDVRWSDRRSQTPDNGDPLETTALPTPPMPDELLWPPAGDWPAIHSAGDDWAVRGTCPSCGSGDVVHRVIGMPIPGEEERAPEWVHFMGCIVDSENDRACSACGYEWQVPE